MKHPKITLKSFKRAELDRKKNQFKATVLSTESVEDVIDDVVENLSEVDGDPDDSNDKVWEIRRYDLMEMSKKILKLAGVKLVKGK